MFALNLHAFHPSEHDTANFGDYHDLIMCRLCDCCHLGTTMSSCLPHTFACSWARSDCLIALHFAESAEHFARCTGMDH
eukprot:1489295-Amphidinium_carterae.1